jgi:hypothetical protein
MRLDGSDMDVRGSGGSRCVDNTRPKIKGKRRGWTSTKAMDVFMKNDMYRGGDAPGDRVVYLVAQRS